MLSMCCICHCHSLELVCGYGGCLLLIHLGPDCWVVSCCLGRGRGGGWWVSGLNVVPKHDHSSPHCFASWWWQHVVVRGEVALVSAPSLAEPTDTDLYLEDLHMPHGSLKLISHYEEENGRTTLINIQLFTMFPMMCLWDFSSEVAVGAVLVFTFSFL